MRSFTIGPACDATRRHAGKNMRAFVSDVGLAGAKFRRRDPIRDGLCDYELRYFDRAVRISMPGCALEVVMAHDFWAPRLYVNGHSFWWRFAVELARGDLTAAPGFQ